jgi:hypothetical protein
MKASALESRTSGKFLMPTDVLLSIEERRLARLKEAADLRAYLFLIPLAVCLLSIILSVESHAFECALIHMGSPTAQD